MASPSIASYFNVRKRAAADEVVNARNKVLRLDHAEATDSAEATIDRNILAKNREADADARCFSGSILKKVTDAPPATASKASEKRTTRRTAKRSTRESSNQPKIVKFTIGGTLSPRKKPNDSPIFQAIERNAVEKCKTPTKTAQTQTAGAADATKIVNKVLTNAKKELTFDEIKSKVTRSAKLEELKAILNKHQQLNEQYKACINKRSAKSAAPTTGKGKSLKAFDTIELEVLTSPQKGLRTPTKTPVKEVEPSPSKHQKGDLMSPKRVTVPRQLFSPTKANPVPAYQRFQTLAESTPGPTLQLPYKYRCLLEVFRCVDSICSMFFNRKETITFKKLKPAVQRMLRKNFSEDHLAQIKYLHPDAYDFYQKKMLNPGSHTKYDYYQMVIVPNVQPLPQPQAPSPPGENVVKNADATLMNPQVMIARYQTFQSLLLDRVKEEHDVFLKKLNPPLNIPKEKIRRWHQEFDLESCPEILPGELPQPPNIEKFTSAKEILSTARNLFNCSTPMERVMERFEASEEAKQPEPPLDTPPASPALENPVEKILKGVPKSLLEKIRAKQAAKALEAMTRRPSQDAEACKYARLPELARYIRNIFVSENKGVLELEKVIAKLENSFREKMSREQLRELLELMSKEAPRSWLSFHFIRKTDFVKINRHENLAEVIKELEQKAQAKAE